MACEQEVGVGFDIEAGVVEEEVCKYLDDKVVVAEGGVRLLNPSEVCFSGSLLSGRKRKGVTGIVRDCQVTCLIKGVLVGMYHD